MGTPLVWDDRKGLGRLIKALEAVVEILRGWQAHDESLGEAPADTPQYHIDAVATAFEAILTELKESGNGHEVYKHFGAIADKLQSAARALTEK